MASEIYNDPSTQNDWFSQNAPSADATTTGGAGAQDPNLSLPQGGGITGLAGMSNAGSSGGNPTDPAYVTQQVTNWMQQHGITPGDRGSGQGDVAYWTDRILQTGGWSGDNQNYWQTAITNNHGGDTGGSQGGSLPPAPTPSAQQTYTAPTFSGSFTPPSFTEPTAASVEATPGYQFGLNQGEQSVLRNAASMGIAATGGTLKDVSDWAQNYATGNYQQARSNAMADYNTQYQGALDAYNSQVQKFDINANLGLSAFGANQGAQAQNFGRQMASWQGNQGAQNQAFNQGMGLANLGLQNYYAGQFGQNQAYNQQSGVAGMGLNATQGQANLYAGQGNAAAGIYGAGASGIAGLQTGIGNVNAAGQVGSANAWSNALGGIANNLGTLYASQGRGLYGGSPNYAGPNPSPYGSSPYA